MKYAGKFFTGLTSTIAGSVPMELKENWWDKEDLCTDFS
jgi:hypothetical protein